MVASPFIDWLLEASTPSIRFLTLSRLLDDPDKDEAIRKSWQAMKDYGPIPTILAQQGVTGAWIGERSYYTPKYTSTHWSMLLLAELAADPSDARLKRGAKIMLDAKENAMLHWINGETHGLSCFWANLLRYVVHAGFEDDPRVAEVTNSLTNEPKTDWRCKYNSEEPCAWGAGRTLWAFSTLPKALKTTEVQAAIWSAYCFLLEEHNILKADYPTCIDGKVSPLWFRLNFPLFYQSDILLVLRALAELKMLDHPAIQPALDWLISIRSKNGCWSGSSPFRHRTWLSLGDRQETQRWVSLQAALILKAV